MGFRSFLIKPFAKSIAKSIDKWAAHAVEAQEKVFQDLINGARHTRFGKDHHFDKITHYESFRNEVPIRDYEGLKTYIELIKQGQSDVLWKGRPMYFAKTSSTAAITETLRNTMNSFHLRNQAENTLPTCSPNNINRAA